MLIGQVYLENVSLTRVIPVEQYDADGNLKVRGVVHCTESGGNPATSPCDRTQTEGLDWLVSMVLWCFFYGHEVVMSKRDVKRAFKTCPLFFEHAEFAWVCFWHDNQVWAAQMRAAPFGAISSVHAWHRLGEAIQQMVKRLGRAPIARWVDDCFQQTAATSSGAAVFFLMPSCSSLASRQMRRKT